MMRFFRKGERYVLSKPIYKSRYLSGFRKSGLVTLLICLFSFHFVCFAQESRESGMTARGEIKPLQIGDTIPEELWNISHAVLSMSSKEVEYQSLSAYRDKILILDFWDIWCGSCLTAMKNAQRLMESQGDKIEIIPVTYLSADHILKFSNKNEIVRSTKLPLVVETNSLKKYFPHISIPHVVMIRDNKVFHIGGFESVSTEGVSAVVEGRSDQFKYFKNDFSENIPLLEVIDSKKAKGYRLLSGYRNDIIRAQGIVKDSLLLEQRIYFYNHSLFELFCFALDLPTSFPINRINIDSTDMVMTDFCFQQDMGDKFDWLSNNAISYEVRTSLSVDRSDIRKMLLEDLQLFIGLSAELQEVPVEVLKIADFINVKHFKKNEKNTFPVFYVLDAYNRMREVKPFLYDKQLVASLFIPHVDLSKMTSDELLNILSKNDIPFNKVTEPLTLLTVKNIKS